MGRKLLLADDSVTIQKVVALTFASEDIEIITASDGQEALDKLEGVTPDVALVDVFMPKRDGYEVCSYIKQTERLNNIPVILLVGAFEPFDEEKARRAGADDYLTKPFQSIRQLVNKVNNLLQPVARPPEDPLAATRPAAESLAAPSYIPANTATYSPPRRTSDLSDPALWAVPEPEVLEEAPPTLVADSYTTDPHALAPPPFSPVGAETVPALQSAEAAKINLDDPSIDVLPLAAEAATTSSETAPTLPEEPFGEAAPLVIEDVEDVTQVTPAAEAMLLVEDAAQDAPTAAVLDEPLLEADEPFILEEPTTFEPLAANEPELLLPDFAFTEDVTANETELLDFNPPAAGHTQTAEAADESLPLLAESNELLDLNDVAAPSASPVDDGLLELEEETPLGLAAGQEPLAELELDTEPLDELELDTDPLGELVAEPSQTPVSAKVEPLTPSWAEQAALLDARLELPALKTPSPYNDEDDDILDFAPAPQALVNEEDSVLEIEPPPAVLAETAGEPELLSELDATQPAAQVTPETEEVLELGFDEEVASAEAAVVSEPESAVAPAPAVAATLQLSQLSPEMIDAIARRVVELMSDQAVREIAWEIVPDLADLHIRRRLDNKE